MEMNIIKGSKSFPYVRYAISGYNSACLRCDDRYNDGINPVDGEVRLAVCEKCKPEASGRVRKTSDDIFDFKNYLRKRSK